MIKNAALQCLVWWSDVKFTVTTTAGPERKKQGDSWVGPISVSVRLRRKTCIA